MEPYAGVVEQYVEFADAAGDSPCFEEWARAVAADPEVLDWVETLPGIKRQPNLVFAAARCRPTRWTRRAAALRRGVGAGPRAGPDTSAHSRGPVPLDTVDPSGNCQS